MKKSDLENVITENVTVRHVGRTSHHSRHNERESQVFFLWPEYQNKDDGCGNVSTVAIAQHFPSSHPLVADISARAFSVNEILKSGSIPQVVNPASVYTMDKTELVNSVNAVVAGIKPSLSVPSSVENVDSGVVDTSLTSNSDKND